jgi:predicted PurR-regulated permease PerM
MFKLLMFFIILGFAILLGGSIYHFTKNFNKNNQKDDLDSLIKGLKEEIEKSEQKARNGQKNAEAELLLFKEKLKKAEDLKEKTKNL